MKFIYSLLATITLTFTGFSQEGFYVKYETNIEATGEEGEMMAMMMNGSTMELAANEDRTWVKTEMGTMMTMEMEYDLKKENMLMFMSGMMGNMAFQGNPDDLDDGTNEEEEDIDMELTNETKKILKFKCKKAIIRDDNGYEAIYWYTEDFIRPEGMDQMPNQVPGLCLEMVLNQEGMTMTYTAIDVKEKAKMADYKVVIPEGVEIKSLEDMKNLGM
jgi:GLPGLI family protein